MTTAKNVDANPTIKLGGKSTHAEMGKLVVGMNKGAALEYLIREGYSYKDAELYWKDNGARTKSTGFRAEFYAALKDGAQLTDKPSLLEFMEEHGASANDKKHYTHYQTIARLVDEVRS